MNFSNGTTTSGPGTISRRLLALPVLLALLVGSRLAPGVNAEKLPANGVSIAKRVGFQKQLCEDGGSFESMKTAFGSTITTCSGGEEDGRTCVNTVQSTDCRQGLTRPPEEVNTPPTEGVYEEPVLGGIQTGNVTGSAPGAGLARAAEDDRKTERGKATNMKSKGKKGKAGGNRRK